MGTAMSWPFLITSLAIVATPGTGAILTISAGLVRGRRVAVVTAFGCTLGVIPHLAAAVTGAAALLHASGVAFEILKFIGVAYLLYLAWCTWRDRGELRLDGGRAPASTRKTITTAILANLLNPKLTLFFFAFLPQFISGHAANPTAEMVTLGTVFMALTFVIFAAYGIAAGAMRDHVIGRPAVVRAIQRTFALSYVALGAKLAVTER